VLLKPGRLDEGELRPPSSGHPSASAQLAERAELTRDRHDPAATITSAGTARGYPHGLAGRAHSAGLARCSRDRQTPYETRCSPTGRIATRDDGAAGEAGSSKAGARETQFRTPLLVEAFLRRGIGHSAQLRPQRTGSPLSLARPDRPGPRPG